MFSMSYNIVYNISCSPSPEPGQALLGFHKNCHSSSTDRAECRISSGAAISWRVAMSSIVRGDGGPRHANVLLHVLPDRPSIKRERPSIQRARQGIGIQRARPMHCPASGKSSPALASTLPCMISQASWPGTGIQRAQSGISIKRALPCIGIQHELPCIQHALPCINERCMTVGKALPSPGTIFLLLVLHHEPHPREH